MSLFLAFWLKVFFPVFVAVKEFTDVSDFNHHYSCHPTSFRTRVNLMSPLRGTLHFYKVALELLYTFNLASFLTTFECLHFSMRLVLTFSTSL